MPSDPSSAYPPSLIVYAHLSGTKSALVRLLVDTGATYTMIPLKVLTLAESA